ncbi:Aconitate hydratase precursor [Phycisphaerae bacterium RAS1]|nr:Aconitate hydratase precursor [Phycisphaerae bacterium RAS1]
MGTHTSSFGSFDTISTAGGSVGIFRLAALEKAGLGSMSRLPYSIRVLLEAVLRNVDGFSVQEEHVRNLAAWSAAKPSDREIPFKPARVILQDFTGVPVVVDLAAMRAAMKRLGGDPKKINPQIPVDLVIDHSVQVDHYARVDAISLNAALEFHRNKERYEFLRWGQKAFDNFRVVPPATGIVHQVNLEYLAKTVLKQHVGGKPVALFDTLVGTDSHTTMINGLGVLGWGVGGIEAEASMLAQPMYMLIPEVVGFRLTGKLREGATATDLVLRVTEMLRKKGVVDKFVEFFGDGLSSMSVADRATIANMAPEYGATCGYFPVDQRTLEFLRFTGRAAEEVDLVERYCKEQGVFRTDATPDPEYSDKLELDLATVEPSLAGPKRPQDRVALSAMKQSFNAALRAPVASRGFDLKDTDLSRTADVRTNGSTSTLKHGSVVIAAITSCTNTSNPSVMLAAGLVARKAAARGLKAKPWVKTSLAPGSRVVTDYLDRAGLTADLQKLGFHTVGYGCTTCIGNSGPLPDPIREGVERGNLVVSSVLSGNRNFEGRVNPHVKANYLASPPLVVAYAIAGTTDIDLVTEPIGTDSAGKPVMLKEIWPTQLEVQQAIEQSVTPEMFRRQYANVFAGPPEWQSLGAGGGDLYDWRADSTYVQEPPFFTTLTREVKPIESIRGARCLVWVGDSVTTDHISPAGDISKKGPAGEYLVSLGVKPEDFNSFGSRRGNDRVMTRGTFANVRIRNLLAQGTEGGVTTYFGAQSGALHSQNHVDAGKVMSIYDAAMKYKSAGVPLVVLAGADYGMGSSRDWAAKGTLLLGVRAAIAVSFERIHRSNLVGMGVLPLVFKNGQNAQSLGLTGREVFDIPDLGDTLRPLQDLKVIATDPDSGKRTEFVTQCRVNTAVEVEYYRNGGVLQTVLRSLLK